MARGLQKQSQELCSSLRQSLALRLALSQSLAYSPPWTRSERLEAAEMVGLANFRFQAGADVPLFRCSGGKLLARKHS